MRQKLLIALIDDKYVEEVMDAARQAGATGSTLISQARVEDLEARSGLFGLKLDAPVSILMLAVLAEHAQQIIESIAASGHFADSKFAGIALQMDIEDSVGMSCQWQALQSGGSAGAEEEPP